MFLRYAWLDLARRVRDEFFPKKLVPLPALFRV
jgi:hypothetical protein